VSRIPQQLSLGVILRDDATFENFHTLAGSVNAQAVALLRQQVETGDYPFVYLQGGPGSGLSHLLQAGCHYAQAKGLHIQYLPLAELVEYASVELFADLGYLDYLALDDFHVIAGRREWEQALFHLYNLMRDSGKRLVVSANANVRELPFQLEDLRSRLQWGLAYKISPLNDREKQLALQARAKARGLELGDDVAHYLLQRLPRDMHQLFERLHYLDCASLAEQRKLTIPFVKKILSL